MTTAKLTAYIQGMESGQFNTTAQKIYNRIKQGAQTLETLQVYLGAKHHNSFSGRLSDLLDAGLIKEIKGSRYSIFKVVTDRTEQNNLRMARHVEKYEQWKKKGEEMGWFREYFK